MKKLINLFANANIYTGVVLLIIPVIFVAFPPQKSISAGSTRQDIETEVISQSLFKPGVEEGISQPETILVPENEAVTFGNTIKVPAVGIDTVIYETQSIDAALEKGVWRMPEHGTPANNGTTTVLAAHRWGAYNLSTAKRIKDLFFALDRVNIGDVIEIGWNGKTYRYVVTDKEENSIVSKDPGDLLLVTCKYANNSSPIRILIYADKIT